MKHTTLCYLEKDGKYLMIHRVKKANDENEGKWIGIGGKLEHGETPFDCVKREVAEETGLVISSPRYRGIITFVSDVYGTEYMHLFTATEFTGVLSETCDEGVLKWIGKEKMSSLPMWEGDKIFLDMLDNEDRFFSLKLTYVKDTLVDSRVEY